MTQKEIQELIAENNKLKEENAFLKGKIEGLERSQSVIFTIAQLPPQPNPYAPYLPDYPYPPLYLTICQA